MNDERFDAWRLIRVRGRGPYTGSAWRAAAHIYRDRAINCMEAMRSFHRDMHTWEDAYTELEEKSSQELAQLRAALDVAQQELDQRVALERRMGRELEAARAVVAAAKRACHLSLFDGRGPLVTEIARYDWAVQEARAG